MQVGLTERDFLSVMGSHRGLNPGHTLEAAWGVSVSRGTRKLEVRRKAVATVQER